MMSIKVIMNNVEMAGSHFMLDAFRRMDPIWCSLMSFRICGVTTGPSKPI